MTLFSVSELQSQFPNIIPDSFIEHNGAAFWMQRDARGKRLAIISNPLRSASGTLRRLQSLISNLFDGESSNFQYDHILKLCPLSPPNARALREALPSLKPTLLGLQTSAGFGDRLGLATPGHARALKNSTTKFAPIFAQQSIREMQRTARTPQQVLDDATFGAFEAGWRGVVGADADHLKTPADIDACVAAGYSFFTIDPGAYVDDTAEMLSASAIQEKVNALPWQELESTPRDFETLYAGRTVQLETGAVKISNFFLSRAAAKYGRALAHVARMYRHLAAKGFPFELEISVDETETPTTPIEHIYLASEFKRLGVKFISLAPRYVGRFEKGVDYIGELDRFEADFCAHAEIARVLGPYKLSLHSGSDKFSIYGIAMRLTRGAVHLKTAGTSYLEALRTIAALDAKLFRAIYAFARERYETDRATYHVSAQLDRAPLPDSLRDADLPELLNHFDARQILHVTFGSALTAQSDDGRARFYDAIMAALRAHENAYALNLEKHFNRHLKAFAISVA